MRRKVGKYIAVAESAEDFEALYNAVVAAAQRISKSSGRFLVYSHLINAIAVALKPLHPATKSLLDGYVLEAIARGHIARIIVLSSQLTPYQLLSAAISPLELKKAVEASYSLLNHAGRLTPAIAASCLPLELRSDESNARSLMSHLVYRGLANAVDGAASTVDEVTAVE